MHRQLFELLEPINGSYHMKMEHRGITLIIKNGEGGMMRSEWSRQQVLRLRDLDYTILGWVKKMVDTEL